MSRCKVDFKAIERFQKKMNTLKKEQIQQFNEAAIKELAARLLSKVIKRTPVGVYDNSGSGKVGGTLRRGWTIGEVVKSDGNYTIEVINPVEYASYVEYGHRTRNHRGWVEGRFMLTVSEQELESDAPRILENKLNKFLGDVFNA